MTKKSVFDELTPEAASLFERMCECRIDRVIIKCLVGTVPFGGRVTLVDAGLLVDPGLGQRAGQDDAGTALWWIGLPRDVIRARVREYRQDNDDQVLLTRTIEK